MLFQKGEHKKCDVSFQFTCETGSTMENHRHIGWKGPVEVQPYAQCRTVTNGQIRASKTAEMVPTSFWTEK